MCVQDEEAWGVEMAGWNLIGAFSGTVKSPDPNFGKGPFQEALQRDEA